MFKNFGFASVLFPVSCLSEMSFFSFSYKTVRLKTSVSLFAGYVLCLGGEARLVKSGCFYTRRWGYVMGMRGKQTRGEELESHPLILKNNR